ncbi:MAG TPA: DUF971 domain-containing protein [Aggregatilineales bacterium]|nr:DUF971 domain-containing protein [Aggregatilineales bacterium]
MKNIIRPVSITLNKESGQLLMDWSDGKSCQYPLSQLREACPCVECRGGHHNMGMANAPENILTLLPARSYGVEKLEAVGNYALQFFWDDGHHTGIYTWEYLHKICPEDNLNA